MLVPSYCWRFGCKHYRGVSGDEPTQVAVCEAFPEGIPEEINLGEEFHSEPIDGDHDIQFEVDPELTEQELAARLTG
jgi:hypothetical protein